MSNNDFKYLFLIHEAPPVNGVTVVNSQVRRVFEKDHPYRVRFININLNRSLDDIGKFSFNKLIVLFLSTVKQLTIIFSIKFEKVYISLPPKMMSILTFLPQIAALKLLRKKTIIHLHGYGIQESINKCTACKYLYAWVFNNSEIINLSVAIKNSEFACLKLINTTHHILPNGVDVNSIRSYISHGNVSERDDKKSITYMANLRESKGIFVLIEMLRIATQDNPNIYLEIIGEFRDNETRVRFETMVLGYGLGGRIIMHGQIHDERKYSIISKSHMFVYPTFNDAFPLVVIEAMAAEIPVIATRVGGIPEMLGNENALLFDPGDVIDFAAKVTRLLDDDDVFQRMRQICSARAKDLYTLDNFERGISDIITLV